MYYNIYKTNKNKLKKQTKCRIGTYEDVSFLVRSQGVRKAESLFAECPQLVLGRSHLA